MDAGANGSTFDLTRLVTKTMTLMPLHCHLQSVDQFLLIILFIRVSPWTKRFESVRNVQNRKYQFQKWRKPNRDSRQNRWLGARVTHHFTNMNTNTVAIRYSILCVRIWLTNKVKVHMCVCEILSRSFFTSKENRSRAEFEMVLFLNKIPAFYEWKVLKAHRWK